MSIAVFASGSGSNFEVLGQKSRNWPAPVSLLVCDQPEAGVIERAHRLEIETLVLSPKEFESKVAYEKAILEHLAHHHIEWILLAGYMRLVGATLLQAYPWRIVNIHPSLLPAFQGKNAIQQALAYGVRWTGVTVHWIDEGVDTGPIIDQKPVFVEAGETLASLTKKVQFVEHNLYPNTMYKLLTGKLPNHPQPL